MRRLFFLSSHICAGESGGGHGVIYRLYQANKKYNCFPDDTVFVFRDHVIESCDDFHYVKKEQANAKSSFRLNIRKIIPSFLRIEKMKKLIREIQGYLEQLNLKYRFTDDDVFVFHDFRIAYAFLTAYDYHKTAFVFHMQGSIYYEWHAETGINSSAMKGYFDYLFETITKKVQFMCFPSKGTEESLISSEPELQPYVDMLEKRYLYNGVSCPNIKEQELPNWVCEIQRINCYKFVSIANLNKAKAIERIPQYLAALKSKGIDFRWILVGNGVQAEAVELEINKYGISDKVIWKRDPVPHDQLMALLSITQFYILFHRYSIFDLSTLEAMHYGNIPILSRVGGNKEIIIEDNGVFVDDFTNADNLINVISSGNVDSMAEKNVRIQNEMFDDRAFIERYVGLYKELTEL